MSGGGGPGGGTDGAEDGATGTSQEEAGAAHAGGRLDENCGARGVQVSAPTPLETVSIQPDRWLSTEKWFMDDIESLSLDEKETSTGESKVAGEEGEFITMLR